LGLLILLSLTLLTIHLLFKQKQLNAARRAQAQLSGMLINAQEAERSRLAAEIHDDFSQRLAILALGLDAAAHDISASRQETNQRLLGFFDDVSNISEDLHTLSHRLHASTLESLGLAPGVRAFCREFSAQQGVVIEFTHNDIPRMISPDVALCVFRIVQEGLRNMKKHSRATSADVCPQVSGSRIHLHISDQGVGFDPKEQKTREGLGLRSMGERARFLGGRFEIRSRAGRGTILEVRLPLQPASTALA
jgi:signal transduction histidine kinase